MATSEVLVAGDGTETPCDGYTKAHTAATVMAHAVGRRMLDSEAGRRRKGCVAVFLSQLFLHH